MQWKRCPICARKIDRENGECTREECPFRQKEVVINTEEKIMTQNESKNQE